MFLIRSAFLIAVIVAVMPSDPREQAKLYQTASHALHRAATFCERNETLCREAHAHWEVFKVKAGVAAHMARELVNERLSGETPASTVPAGRLEPYPASDTLTPTDREPTWRHRVRAHL